MELFSSGKTSCDRKKNMIAMVMVVVVFNCGWCTSYEMSLLHQQLLIRSVCQHRDIQSVVLVTSNVIAGEKNYKLFQLQKCLSSEWQYFTAIWGFTHLADNLYKYSTTQNTTSHLRIIVVIHHDSDTLALLSQASRNIQMASVVWLFLTSTPDIPQLQDTVVPFDCIFIVANEIDESNVKLTEIYQLSNHSQLLTNEFGNWSADQGLETVKGELFNRRSNLFGHVFTIALHYRGVYHPGAFCSNDSKTYEKNMGKAVECAYSHMWSDFGRLMNFSYKYVNQKIPEDYTKYVEAPLLKMIQSFEADTTFGTYILTSERLIGSQFLWPILKIKYSFVFKLPSTSGEVDFAAYFRPFSAGMWWATLGWMMVFVVAMLTVEYVANLKIKGKRIPIGQNSLQFCYHVLAAVFGQGDSFEAFHQAGRLTNLILYIVPACLIPIYSGGLTSFLAIPSQVIPFTDMEGFVRDGTYRLGASKDTYFHFLLLNDNIFEPARAGQLVSASMPLSIDDGIKGVCHRRLCFLLDEQLLDLEEKRCRISKLERPHMTGTAAFPVSKQFPFKELFSRYIQQYAFSGIISEMRKKSAGKNLVKQDPKEFQPEPFIIQDVLPLFAFLIAGTSLSFIIVLIEKCYTKENRCLTRRD